MIVTTIIVMKALIAKNVYIAIPFESINVRPTNTSGRMKNMPAIYTIANHLCRAVNFPNFFDKGIGILKILEKNIEKIIVTKRILDLKCPHLCKFRPVRFQKFVKNGLIFLRLYNAKGKVS